MIAVDDAFAVQKRGVVQPGEQDQDPLIDILGPGGAARNVSAVGVRAGPARPARSRLCTTAPNSRCSTTRRADNSMIAVQDSELAGSCTSPVDRCR